jgi:Ca2+:H+ antiporter
MMAMAVISLLVPALFVRAVPGLQESAANPRIEALSLGVAGVLVALYIGSLIFSLYTHESLFLSAEECAEQPEWKQSTALLTLAVVTVLIAIESEFLVGSIGTTVAQWGLSKLFVGIIIVPIVGNAAEHSTAVMMALRNKMDISMNIAVSSSTQVAMFVAPVLIFVSLLQFRVNRPLGGGCHRGPDLSGRQNPLAGGRAVAGCLYHCGAGVLLCGRIRRSLVETLHCAGQAL